MGISGSHRSENKNLLCLDRVPSLKVRKLGIAKFEDNRRAVEMLHRMRNEIQRHVSGREGGVPVKPYGLSRLSPSVKILRVKLASKTDDRNTCVLCGRRIVQRAVLSRRVGMHACARLLRQKAEQQNRFLTPFSDSCVLFATSVLAVPPQSHSRSHIHAGGALIYPLACERSPSSQRRAQFLHFAGPYFYFTLSLALSACIVIA